LFTDKIGKIRLDFPPIVEVKRQTTVAISLYDLFNVSYDGAVNVTILSDAAHQTQPNMLYYEHTPSVILSHFSYSVSSKFQVIITASNLVSKLSVSFTIEVVRKYSSMCSDINMHQMSQLGTNVTISLKFDVEHLSQANVSYKDSLWREKFSDIVDNTLTTVSGYVIVVSCAL